jgi:uncharacterized membrane protein
VPRRPGSGDQTGLLLLAGATLARSLPIDGSRRAGGLLATSLAASAIGEFFAAGVFGWIEHRLPNRVGGVPLALLPAWYTATATGYHLAAAALPADAPAPAQVAGAALAATAADLALDPYGLGRGLWVWRRDGGYAPSVLAANGRRGTPWANYAGWLALTAAVAFAHRRRAGPRAPLEALRARRRAPFTVAAYLASVLPALAWAARHRHWDALLPATLALVLVTTAVLAGRQRSTAGRPAVPMSRRRAWTHLSAPSFARDWRSEADRAYDTFS